MSGKNKLIRNEINLIFAPKQDAISTISISSPKGEVQSSFNSYGDNFLGGVNIAVGDVDQDGQDDIVTGAGFGGGPHVRIFDQAGNLKGQFFAYNENFRGGVNVAVGDVNGNGQDEIIAGAGFGGGPQVRIFQAKGQVEGQFFAYDKNFRGGVNVAVGRLGLGGNGHKEYIITAPGKSGGPHVRIFDNRSQVISQFFAYDKNFRGGVNVALADIDRDGIDEVITGAGSGGAPHVRVFEKDGVLINSFYAAEKDFIGGINVEAIKTRVDI